LNIIASGLWRFEFRKINIEDFTCSIGKSISVQIKRDNRLASKTYTFSCRFEMQSTVFQQTTIGENKKEEQRI
jgi:hypothetical protein